MRSIVATSHAPLDQLRTVDSPDLHPGPGQVIVEVEAAGVNFVDSLLVQGLYQVKPPLPYTPGTEVAGRIGAVGEGVVGLAAGQRVLALPSSGGYATQVTVAATSVIALPDVLSAGQAAGLVQSYGTMLYALSRRTEIVRDEWVVVLGAGGGIGLAAVDLASSLGARVLACASSVERLALATAAGATTTIDYGTDDDFDLKAAIREVTGGGADIVVDPIGGAKSEQALRALRWGGRFLVIGFAAGEIPRIALNHVLLGSRAVIGVAWGFWIDREPEENAAMMRDLMGRVADGAIHPVEPAARPLEDAVDVLHDLQSRRVTGKVVLVP